MSNPSRAGAPPRRPGAFVEVVLKNGTEAEALTRTVLLGLLAKYDLTDWIFTSQIEVDETAVPHSHPTLTLHTRFEQNEALLLATFVHEQLHWFEERHTVSRDLAIEETGLYYADVPGEPPEGASDERSTRLHLLVCYLEYQAMKSLLGTREARTVIRALGRTHYSWIYSTVLKDQRRIGAIIEKYDLLPEGLRKRNEGGRSSPGG